ncbi:hypothetical protein C8Q73DRAFT_682951 [Cubamyces lactineus]|nr:hypothetical protein C8Q73DRAFT_682951 [Cubamyces lactineus]
MFVQLSLFSALVLAPLASALTLQTPVDWHSSSQVNISWASTPTDPPFSLQLANQNEFHDTFSIANNLNPSANFASFQLGVVPEGSYTLRAINVTNEGQIYDETPQFQILAPVSTTASSTTSASATTSGNTSATATGTGSSTLTVTATSSSGFGVTVSNTGTGSNTASNTASGTASSDTAVPSNFNGGGNGAASLPRLAPWALAALGVVAGAAAAL